MTDERDQRAYRERDDIPLPGPRGRQFGRWNDDAPLTLGGQGRTAQEVREDGAWVLWCCGIAVALILGLWWCK